MRRDYFRFYDKKWKKSVLRDRSGMEEKRDGTYIGSIWKRENYTASDPHRRYRSGSRTGKTDEKQDSEAVSPSGGKAGHLVCTSRV